MKLFYFHPLDFSFSLYYGWRNPVCNPTSHFTSGVFSFHLLSVSDFFPITFPREIRHACVFEIILMSITLSYGFCLKTLKTTRSIGISEAEAAPRQTHLTLYGMSSWGIVFLKIFDLQTREYVRTNKNEFFL